MNRNVFVNTNVDLIGKYLLVFGSGAGAGAVGRGTVISFCSPSPRVLERRKLYKGELDYTQRKTVHDRANTLDAPFSFKLGEREVVNILLEIVKSIYIACKYIASWICPTWLPSTFHVFS